MCVFAHTEGEILECLASGTGSVFPPCLLLSSVLFPLPENTDTVLFSYDLGNSISFFPNCMNSLLNMDKNN